MNRTDADALADLPLTAAAAAIRAGRIAAVDLVRACLRRIAAVDAGIRAWTFLDPDHAIRQAEAADAQLKAGLAVGALHGVPLGIKDIFDTADMPTECGSPLHAGRMPSADATCVARLRAAGAVVMGKTVTTEFAYFHPGRTANPHDPARTPGGSSSGSAAAVAAGMVPGAIGSQTNGSVIRPASFCGVVGFKPTHGLLPRSGVLMLSRALDHVGVFARTVEDAALLVEAMAGFDAADPDTRLRAGPPLAALVAQDPPAMPRLAAVTAPGFERIEPAARQSWDALLRLLGARVVDIELPAAFAQVVGLHGTVMAVEMAANLAREYDSGHDKLSPQLIALLERGHTALALDYRRGLDGAAALNAALQPIFAEFDAILTLAALGAAPVGLDSTGDPVMCTPWTYLGVPAVTLPILTGDAGLPLGAQLVGRRDDDARLLRSARWLVQTVEDAVAAGGADQTSLRSIACRTST